MKSGVVYSATSSLSLGQMLLDPTQKKAHKSKAPPRGFKFGAVLKTLEDVRADVIKTTGMKNRVNFGFTSEFGKKD